MRVVRIALVAAAIAVTGAFFFSRWAINASLTLAAVALTVSVIGLLRRRRHVLDLIALAVSLLPAAFLLALDYRPLLSR